MELRTCKTQVENDFQLSTPTGGEITYAFGSNSMYIESDWLVTPSEFLDSVNEVSDVCPQDAIRYQMETASRDTNEAT
jgi:hypothetical protein